MNHTLEPKKGGLIVAQDKHDAIAETWAAALMNYVTGENLVPSRLDEPGMKGTSEPTPDCLFQDSRLRQYTVEVTRLLPPDARSLQAHLNSAVADPVKGRLPGTFVLELRASQLVNAFISSTETSEVRALAEKLVETPELASNPLAHGRFRLYRVRNDGSLLVPWILRKSFEAPLNPVDPDVTALVKEAAKVVKEADRKLVGSRGVRILLVHAGQTGLDRDLHWLFPDSQQIIWDTMVSHSRLSRNLDAVFVDPGVRVWLPSNGVIEEQTVFTGQKFVGDSAGFFTSIWKRPRIQLSR